jgi:hypothetical protein
MIVVGARKTKKILAEPVAHLVLVTDAMPATRVIGADELACTENSPDEPNWGRSPISSERIKPGQGPRGKHRRQR